MNITEYENYQENLNQQGNPFPYLTYLCSIPHDFTCVPLHWHDEMELIYIKKGSGIVDVDFKKLFVARGDIIFVCPGQLHSIRQMSLLSMEYENIIFLCPCCAAVSRTVSGRRICRLSITGR